MQKIDLAIFKEDGPLRVEGAVEIELDSNTTIDLPIYFIQNGNGPRLAVVGAQHSVEYCGTDAIIKLIRDLRETDIQQINGSILLIPVANVTGYPVRAHNVSQFDGTNLNRSYPGNPAGNNSERIAHAIWSMVKTCDYALDLHGGDMNEDIIQYAEMHDATDEQFQKSLELAACFDLEVVLKSISGTDYAYPDFKSLYGLAQENGIAASIVEAGGSGISDEKSIDYFYKGLKAVLHRTKILKATEPTEIPKRKLWITNWVSCIERPNEGVFISRVSAGDIVSEGETIGSVHNYFGDVVDTIKSPRTGIVSLVQSSRGKNPDDMIYMIIDKEKGEYLLI